MVQFSNILCAIQIHNDWYIYDMGFKQKSFTLSSIFTGTHWNARYNDHQLRGGVEEYQG